MKKEFDVLFIRSADNLADIFTKQQPKANFRSFRDAIKGAIKNHKEPEFEITQNLSELLENDGRPVLQDS